MDQALAQLFPQYSRSRLQAWLKSGHILVDGAAGTAKQAVSGGERLALSPPQPPAGGSPRAQRMPLSIVHEDRDLIVIDKPAGLVVHPGARVPEGTLLNALLAHAPELAVVPRAGIVYVMGFGVAQQGGYVLQNHGEQVTVLKAIALAHGLTSFAKADDAVIMRTNAATGQKDEIPVHIKKIQDRKAPDIPLQSNDILYIPDSAGKKALARGVQAALGIGTQVAVYRIP